MLTLTLNTTKKATNVKNVLRYLQTAARNTQFALHSYKQANNSSYKYAARSAATAQHYFNKHAHIAANAQHYNTLINAQHTLYSATHMQATHYLMYIIYAYKQMQKAV